MALVGSATIIAHRPREVVPSWKREGDGVRGGLSVARDESETAKCTSLRHVRFNCSCGLLTDSIENPPPAATFAPSSFVVAPPVPLSPPSLSSLSLRSFSFVHRNGADASFLFRRPLALLCGAREPKRKALPDSRLRLKVSSSPRVRGFSAFHASLGTDASRLSPPSRAPIKHAAIFANFFLI